MTKIDSMAKYNQKVSSQDIHKLVSDMVRIPSVNTNVTEKDLPQLNKAAEFVQTWLRGHGVESKVNTFSKNYPVVIAEVGSGARTIMLNGHMDVVPIGEKKGWTVDPFGGTIMDGKIYGRGSTDMKAGLSVFMALTAELANNTNNRIIFAAVSDEETGGFNCSKYVAEKYSPDLVLVSEPKHPDNICLGEKGVLEIKLTATGKPAHSSVPSKGKNAITMMMGDLGLLSAIEKQRSQIPPEVQEMISNSLEIYGSDVSKITFNPAIIWGGEKANMVPDSCNVVINMRIPPGLTTDQVMDLTRKLIRSTEIEQGPKAESSYTSPSNGYVLKFRNVVDQQFPGPKFIITPGASDGRYFRYKGIPAIEYGPGEVELMHNYDEYVSTKDLDSCYKIYMDFLSSPLDVSY